MYIRYIEKVKEKQWRYKILCVYIYPRLSQYEDGTQLIFKRILVGSDKEFSFNKTSYQTKVADSSLPYDVPIVLGKLVGFIVFPKIICAMLNG